MNYEDIDADTRAIIESMVYNTGKTKEEAILALVEVGMIAMIASVEPHAQKQRLIMKKVFDTVSNDKKMKATAEAYKGYWDLGI